MSRVMFLRVRRGFPLPMRNVRVNVMLKLRIVEKLWKEKKFWA